MVPLRGSDPARPPALQASAPAPARQGGIGGDPAHEIGQPFFAVEDQRILPVLNIEQRRRDLVAFGLGTQKQIDFAIGQPL